MTKELKVLKKNFFSMQCNSFLKVTQILIEQMRQSKLVEKVSGWKCAQNVSSEPWRKRVVECECSECLLEGGLLTCVVCTLKLCVVLVGGKFTIITNYRKRKRTHRNRNIKSYIAGWKKGGRFLGGRESFNGEHSGKVGMYRY